MAKNGRFGGQNRPETLIGIYKEPHFLGLKKDPGLHIDAIKIFKRDFDNFWKKIQFDRAYM